MTYGQIFGTGQIFSLWYWLLTALIWVVVSHSTLGVPNDLAIRARRGEDAARSDIVTLAGIHARRLDEGFQLFGAWISGLLAFVLTVLALTGLWLRVEPVAALFLLALPLSLVLFRRRRLAARVLREEPDAEALLDMIGWHRFWTQAIGLLSIFLAVFIGVMLHLIRTYPPF
ncbi:component of SufBCD complex [Oceanomicrobium pacificus]|uniref:Component of SufBCD complex n=1 Tax=Oceanomicrobium pacificus TaxID=2692916 RepID=A0A6B0TXW9_9RHOB|nr:component of SufBCD complex [Oceanomicrobium pacificus]MXU65853.1 component of SufBCD complex [Oceanomicrobium pacificus]